MLHGQITDKILKAFYNVYNTLGYGFLEKVYENALVHELREMGLEVVQQKPIKVYYDGVLVGDYLAGMEVGLLSNFGERPEFVRRILTNDRKKIHPNPRESVLSVFIRVLS